MDQYINDRSRGQSNHDLEEDESEEQFYDFDPEDYDGTGGSTPTASGDGLLPRDKQRKTAYYDYTSEKTLSHADAKLFYQRHQLEQQINYSPLRRAWTVPSIADTDISNLSLNLDAKRDTTSSKYWSTVPGPRKDIDKLSETHQTQLPSLQEQKNLAPSGNEASTAIEKPAGRHTAHIEVSQDARSSLLVEQGIYGAGAGVGIGSGVGGFATNSTSITSELSAIYTNIQKILDMRHKFIRLSLQEPGDNPKDDPGWNIYPPPPEPVWDEENNRPIVTQPGSEGTIPVKVLSAGVDMSSYQQKDFRKVNKPQSTRTSPPRRPRKPGTKIGEDFDILEVLPIPEESEMAFKLDGKGVFQVYETSESAKLEAPIISIPTIRDFYMGLDTILQISSDGPAKSFAFRRLQFLEGKYNLYFLLNEYQEMADSKRVPHRDFYNVRKVDTHVHHSACMNQKHLLRFIKSKMKKSPDEIVMYRDGKHLTLREVFESINLTAYDLSIDTLDMHVRLSINFPKK